VSQRRGQGEDSVYRDGDRWRGAISLGWGPDGKRRRKKVSGKTRTEVVAKLRRLRTQFDAGLPMPDDRLTVAGYLERWLVTTLPSQVGPSTRDDYEDIVRLHLLPGLGRKKLSQLTPADVNAVWESKRETYAASSIRKMRAVLRSALSDAERASLVARNVAALSTAPRLDTDEGRSLSLKQARSLLDSVSGDRLEAPVTLMLAFGLRRGETLGVRWSDVDWDEHTLHLVKSVKRCGHEPARPRHSWCSVTSRRGAHVGRCICRPSSWTPCAGTGRGRRRNAWRQDLSGRTAGWPSPAKSGP